MSQEKKTLVALETAQQVGTWLKLDNRDRDAVVVALSAAVDDLLDCAGVAHLTIEDFYSEAELVDRSAENNAAVEELCTAIDRLLGVHVTAELPEFSAHYHVGRLRVLYDTLQRAAFCLDAMLDRIRPEKVMAGAGSAIDPSEIWLRKADFLSIVLAEICRQRAVQLDLIGVAEQAKAAGILPFRRLVAVARKIRDTVRNFFPQKGDVAYVMWPDMPAAELARANLKPLRLTVTDSTSNRCAPAETESFASLEWFFEFGGRRMFDLAEPFLVTLAGSFRTRHLRQLRRTERVLRRADAKACVATAPLGIETVAAVLGARRLGIPAIVLQHGGFNGYAEWSMLPFTDFNLSDFYLCFGPAVADRLMLLATKRNAVRTGPVSIAAVGSQSIYAIWQSRQAATQQHGRPRAIYVPTFLAGSSRYMAGHHRPDIAYWRQQKRVLGTLLARNDWDIEFRPAPANFVDNPILPWLARQTGEKLRLRSGEQSLAAILREEHFDLIVTDAVSTVLLEALASNAQVVTQFDGTVMKVHPDALDLLRRRASVSFTEDDFIADIVTALDRKNSSTAVDDEFLFQYALAGDDNAPSASTVSAIEQILEERRRAI